MGFWKSGQQFFQIWFKLEIWNVIPIGLLQMRLSLDALLAQLRFKMVFCIALNASHNNNVKTGDGNGRIILKAKKRYINKVDYLYSIQMPIWQHGTWQYIPVSSVPKFFFLILFIYCATVEFWTLIRQDAFFGDQNDARPFCCIHSESDVTWACLRLNQSNPCK